MCFLGGGKRGWLVSEVLKSLVLWGWSHRAVGSLQSAAVGPPPHPFPPNPPHPPTGNEKALVSAEVLDGQLDIAGAFAFLLWRSVYITKQVSFRNRVLILFDWFKAKLFGRDLSQF